MIDLKSELKNFKPIDVVETEHTKEHNEIQDLMELLSEFQKQLNKPSKE